jgi:hypothetical protein
MQAAQAAQIALEAGRDADKKLAEQDAKNFRISSFAFYTSIC